MQENFDYARKRMKFQLQALALPPEIQLRLLPDFVCKSDELALDYGHYCLMLLSNDEGQLTSEQRLLLTLLDNYFAKTILARDYRSLTDAEILDRSEWHQTREMAVELLGVFGWPLEEPAEPI